MKLKNVITIGVIIILLFFIKNIVTSIFEHYQNENVVRDLQNRLEKEKREQAFLDQRLSEVKSDEFVEREARQKLGLVRENEQPVFIIPPSPTPTPVEQAQENNIEKWRNLFRL